jgi:hypothetical protein
MRAWLRDFRLWYALSFPSGSIERVMLAVASILALMIGALVVLAIVSPDTACASEAPAYVAPIPFHPAAHPVIPVHGSIGGCHR